VGGGGKVEEQGAEGDTVLEGEEMDIVQQKGAEVHSMQQVIHHRQYVEAISGDEMLHDEEGEGTGEEEETGEEVLEERAKEEEVAEEERDEEEKEEEADSLLETLADSEREVNRGVESEGEFSTSEPCNDAKEPCNDAKESYIRCAAKEPCLTAHQPPGVDTQNLCASQCLSPVSGGGEVKDDDIEREGASETSAEMERESAWWTPQSRGGGSDRRVPRLNFFDTSSRSIQMSSSPPLSPFAFDGSPFPAAFTRVTAAANRESPTEIGGARCRVGVALRAGERTCQEIRGGKNGETEGGGDGVIEGEGDGVVEGEGDGAIDEEEGEEAHNAGLKVAGVSV